MKELERAIILVSLSIEIDAKKPNLDVVFATKDLYNIYFVFKELWQITEGALKKLLNITFFFILSCSSTTIEKLDVTVVDRS